MQKDRRALLVRAVSSLIAGRLGHWRGLLAMPVPGLAGSAGAEAFEVPDLHAATVNHLLGPTGPRGGAIAGSTRRYKPYPGRPRRRLPDEGPAPPMTLAAAVRNRAPGEGASESLPLALLSRLLRSTNGVTRPDGFGPDTVSLRAAPSAGALYAGEVYVVSSRVEGLPRGVWYYDVEGHALVDLQRGDVRAHLLEAFEQPPAFEGAAAFVLLSNVFARYRRRYANRGYRYALIDSGHIGENLRLAAAAAGWGCTWLPDFHDDRSNDILGIDGRGEAVCAVHVLGGPAAVRDAAPAVRSLAEKRRADGIADVVEAWHEATKLEVQQAAAVRPKLRRLPSGPVRSAIDLPRLEAEPEMSLERSIRSRRSAIRFARDPLRQTDLAFALEMAHGHRPLERMHGVDLHVVVHRAEGIAPGHYRYDVEEHRLALLDGRPLEGAMVRACLGQRMAGEAAVGCVMVARLGEEGALARTRRYRDLLVEAGAIGERIYLAAESLGVAARNLAAYRDGAFNDLLGLDGKREAVVHLTLLGPGD